VKWVIEVSAAPTPAGWSCQVRVADGDKTVSEHEVEVTRFDRERLAPGSSVEDLVRRSVDFLLEREPPQSILRRFALPEIESYFPEYPRVIST
jgi:hypothetical protein